ncbi:MULTISPECIES: undecaprenyl-diphosphate phosphatase [Subtercola]|uniref:Undecaprenyl-diphosphatase n=1 Tax=Subtercola vilae TaxID=2056433 RepID=A0A4T2C8X1_9MICO|nr:MULTISPECIES: undecaprenyl-diphosphate phosphatase [Subtercola]MEA9984340.1 undecaprenyl-diphosphate phosphatase [Subtercola sp. RTI3]TIH40092.1 undecaprenyl-diphosphate phosphatase [Subtercola vilae]
MSQLTYLEAIVMGVIQGISELFPISSLGHSILIPAIVGGSWATDMNVSAPDSPYLAFIVGLHVATALALIVFFRKDWARIVVGLVTSIRYRRISTAPERLAWLLIIATIPVAIAGLLLDHVFRSVLGVPMIAAIFLTVNGFVLLLSERFGRRSRARTPRAVVTVGAHAAIGSVEPDDDDAQVDAAVSSLSFPRAIAVGASQILALLPGISRSGISMVGGMAAGLSNREAARFSFLLATPVILAAGVLKLPDLFGPLGQGIQGQVLAGSAAAFVSAFIAVRFLDRYFRSRTLVPFAVYSVVGGLFCIVFFAVR